MTGYNEHNVEELMLFGVNDASLYRQRTEPILKNLHAKLKSGKYKGDLSVKLWRYWADDAAKRYAKEFARPADWNQIFSVADRNEAAKRMRSNFEDEAKATGKMKRNPARGTKKMPKRRNGRTKKAMIRRAKVRRYAPINRDPRISITYDIVTPESAEVGDYAESGWYDEDGVSMKPDRYDRQELITVVDKAVKFLRSEGASEPSSSHFHAGIWYSSWPDTDYGTGEAETRSYHLDGFTQDEEKQIFNRMTRRR